MCSLEASSFKLLKPQFWQRSQRAGPHNFHSTKGGGFSLPSHQDMTEFIWELVCTFYITNHFRLMRELGRTESRRCKSEDMICKAACVLPISPIHGRQECVLPIAQTWRKGISRTTRRVLYVYFQLRWQCEWMSDSFKNKPKAMKVWNALTSLTA